MKMFGVIPKDLDYFYVYGIFGISVVFMLISLFVSKMEMEIIKINI